MIRYVTVVLFLIASAVSAAPLDTAFTYQGELRVAGIPANGAYDFRLRAFDAASGGAQVGGIVNADDVGVLGGVFTVDVDLGTGIIADRQLWLAVEVRDGASTGAYTLLAPRQRLALAPAAGYALGATVAHQALGLAAENLLIVSPDGAPYNTVAAALAAVQSPGPTNRWQIFVAPGVYVENGPLTVLGYVHLRGAGADVTVIRSTNGAASPGNAAATIELRDNAVLSDIAVENTGTSTFGIGVYLAQPASRATRIERVYASAIGAGGTGHYAVYLNDAEPTIVDSRLRAAGAVGFGTAVNAAVGVVNISGGFPRPLITGSRLLGNEPLDAIESCAGSTGTGFAIQGVNAAPVVRNSFLCGDRRAIFIGTNGIARIEQSTVTVSSTSGSFMVETTSAGTVLISRSEVRYVGNKFTGTGSLGCVLNVSATHTALSNGNTPATACN